ncbi:hypothetical protein BJX61DRAFT_538436 [Aspergillus egyptiacus]|nr:hypothetical protein BJX61DRAFT_538436 [Aspergillus egyptiacus]
MAYYDTRPYPPHDRYPPADYPEAPYYHGGSAYSGSGTIAPPPVGGGSRDAYYHGHPAREGHRSHSAGYYDDSYDYERPSRRSRHHDERRGREKYAYSPSSSRSPPRRRRSLSERALGALGLGAAARAASKHRGSGRGRSRGRDHSRSYSSSPSPPRGNRHRREKSEQRMEQVIKSALTAGAVEAFRARKEPGDWSGPKGKRVLTAALAAGGVDGLLDRNPDRHSKRHILESTLAGLATNRVVHGSRSRSRSHRRSPSRSRSRSRSRGRGGAKNAALMGILAAAGKEAYDRYQKSRSRSRPRRRSSSRDSYDDYHRGSRPRHSKRRSRSVSDYVNRGMAALGLADKDGRSDKDDRQRHDRHRSSRHDDYYSDDDDDDYYRRHPSPARARHSRDVSRPYYAPAAGARGAEGYYGRRQSDLESYYPRSDSQATHGQQRDTKQNGSDADDSTDERKKLKKLNRETLWATSIAAAATVHMAKSLAEDFEKHKHRAKLLKEGEISPEEARRLHLKNQLSDVASVGVAALSIRSAVSEWKHFNQKRRERAQLHKACKERSKSLSNSKRRSKSGARRARSLDRGAPWTVYPDEIEENISASDARSRSTRRSPSAMYSYEHD